MNPCCTYTHEHCHAICNECFKSRDEKLHMVDWVSGDHPCCYCGGPDAKRWVTKVKP